MIKNRKDYIEYLKADQISLGGTSNLKQRLFDDIWRFQRLMRKLELRTNCKKNLVLRKYTKYRYMRLSKKLGFSIPINVFGPGLSIAHYGTIVVNSGTRVGANCRLHVCVNLGTKAGESDSAPDIGDNCYIGPGAKLFGPIKVGDNTVIGANAVVNRSFPKGHCSIGGVPAKKISDNTSEGLLIKGCMS